jgi:hypothetical protein
MKCVGGCIPKVQAVEGAQMCFECHEPEGHALSECNVVLDLSNARVPPGVDLVPTFTTNNRRMCLLLATRGMGMLRVEDVERLQVCRPRLLSPTAKPSHRSCQLRVCCLCRELLPSHRQLADMLSLSRKAGTFCMRQAHWPSLK